MDKIETIDDLEALEQALEGSHRRPVWIFKHSLVCPISTRAWDEFQRFVTETAELEADFTLIEIQKARPVSNALAERTGVRHESPQAILLAGGRPVWHASHHEITTASLADASSRL